MLSIILNLLKYLYVVTLFPMLGELTYLHFSRIGMSLSSSNLVVEALSSQKRSPSSNSLLAYRAIEELIAI